ncbi:MAG: ammonium transporter [Alphaproteobacteria bacterium]
MLIYKKRLSLFPLLTLLLGGFSAAADELNSGDTAWILTATALVLMMSVPGLALFYGGMVRRKNILATVGQSFASAIVISLIWVIVGYSLAAGEGNAYIGDFSMVFLKHLTLEGSNGSLPESLFITFQMTFAIITAAIITGAFADRMKFSSFLIFISIWSIVVYSPVWHWVWGGGFLSNDGVLDYAGGTVVHITAGVSGLVAAIIIKPRYRFGKENMAPDNLAYTLIGGSLLWVGWFGFNAGSAVAADGSAGMAILVTQIAAAAGGFWWTACEWAIRNKPSILGMASGVVAGLVGITPASGFVDPMGALFIGSMTSIGCFFASTSLKNKLKYDDSLDAFGIHGIGGLIGAVLTGVFAKEAIGGTKGALEGNLYQVWLQIEGVIATIVISVIGTAVILYAIKATIGLRVTKEEEIEGLDQTIHGETIH